MDVMAVVMCQVISPAGKYDLVKNKTYRMMRTRSGVYVPRDPTYMLKGPADCAKSAIKEVVRKVTNETGSVEVPGAGGSEDKTPAFGS